MLYRNETDLPLSELAVAWADEWFSGFDARELVLALMRDIAAGLLDQPEDGQPSIRFDDRTGRLFAPLSGEEIRRDLGRLLWRHEALDINEARLQLAPTLRISRAAALEFAKRRGIRPPWFWVPAIPAKAEAPSETVAVSGDAEAQIKEFIDANRGKVSRERFRDFCNLLSIPKPDARWAELAVRLVDRAGPGRQQKSRNNSRGFATLGSCHAGRKCREPAERAAWRRNKKSRAISREKK